MPMRPETSTSRFAALAAVGLFCGIATTASGAELPAPDAAGIEFFEKKIRPVFAEHCYKCHSAQAQELKGGLRLDYAAGVLRGGESGPAIVPGRPEESRLIRAVKYIDGSLKMPPRQQLPPEVIVDLEKWVAMGAPDPRAAEPQTLAPSEPAGIDYDRGREFWSFRPARDPVPPAIGNSDQVRSPIDQFILGRLEASQLAPAPPADKRTLLRRATFDLIGLPPTESEIADFLADDSPQAFAKVIDRLLGSPRYGERWGRHWLDVVRYTDSFDKRFENMKSDITHAWRYRDWVVQAFNRDLPYDRFLIDQIAGDILLERGGELDQLVATGMLAIGEWGTGDSDKRKVLTDIVDDQLDVVGRGVLGVTLTCARCHDHKFDPISTQDYYALAGFFFSSHILPVPGDPGAACDVLEVMMLKPAERQARKELEARSTHLTAKVTELRNKGVERLAMQVRGRTAEYLAAVAALPPVAVEQGVAGAAPASSAEESRASAIDFLASERGLNPLILQRWLAYLGLPDGSRPHVSGLLAAKFAEIGGQKGVPGWGDAAATPWVIANSDANPRQVLSFRVPARGLAAHPSPERPVAIGWRSPISATVTIRGRIVDTDPNCGDGIAWTLEIRRGAERRVLRTGTIDNNGMEIISDLKAVQVDPGDLISLLIDAKAANHSCDTTAIELTITDERDEGRVWDLCADVVDDLHAGNPHADRLGNPNVWHFYALNGPQPAQAIAPDSALGRWAAARCSGAAAEELTALAAAVQEAISSATPAAPDDLLHKALSSPDGYFLRAIDVTTALEQEDQQTLAQWSRELAEIRTKLATPVPLVHAIQEGGVPTSEHEGFHDAKVHIRGRYDRLGETVPRGFPRVLLPPLPSGEGGGEGSPHDNRLDIPPNTSGRLELAQWLASRENPLTARVMVNRIWQHHFGRGIVATADNFGSTGSAPTHPELLDWLASRFIESGWSIKAMHRRIMLSSTYQQSSIGDPHTVAADPENNLLGRMNRRRLEVEALRDALLTAAGRLDMAAGGPAAPDPMTPRRTIYIQTVRSDGANFRKLFDGADPTAIVAMRGESTVAPQSLYLLNDQFVLTQSRAIAERLIAQDPGDDRQRISRLYEWLYARPPANQELAIGLEFLMGLGGAGKIQAWQAYAQVLVCANEFIYLD